jgi:2-iminobutanoate/2-iminopropanoate deaminase
MKKVISTTNAPKAIGPYSQATQAGDFLFCSGQGPMNVATGQMAEGDIGAKTRQVMDNLGALLAAAGYAWADVVKTTVFLKDMNQFAAMNEAYGSYFATEPPARSTIQAARLPRDIDVEIELVAYKSSKG